jgi:hypothetical protein
MLALSAGSSTIARADVVLNLAQQLAAFVQAAVHRPRRHAGGYHRARKAHDQCGGAEALESYQELLAA